MENIRSGFDETDYVNQFWRPTATFHQVRSCSWSPEMLNLLLKLFCRWSTSVYTSVATICKPRQVLSRSLQMQYTPLNREICVYSEDWDHARNRKQSSRREKILATGREARAEELWDTQRGRQSRKGQGQEGSSFCTWWNCIPVQAAVREHHFHLVRREATDIRAVFPHLSGPRNGGGVAMRSGAVTRTELYSCDLVSLAKSRLKYFLILWSRTTTTSYRVWYVWPGPQVRCVRVISGLFAAARLPVLGPTCCVGQCVAAAAAGCLLVRLGPDCFRSCLSSPSNISRDVTLPANTPMEQ